MLKITMMIVIKDAIIVICQDAYSRSASMLALKFTFKLHVQLAY